MVILNVIFRWTMVLGSLLLSGPCFSQAKEKTFQEVEQLQSLKPKPLVVFVHTDWCGYCAMMEHATFENDDIVKLLNDHFYFTTLDAESKEAIVFGGHTFKFKPTGYNTGVHELALALAEIDGKLSYPTITILNEKQEIIFQYGGYLDDESLKEILTKII